ncbi:hypothetical protein [Devosia lacusdianchii]|jgi:hypothetical protein|uniref:hypothetical protein n=1 Tax=Devosia lacusdianchii TaxID=2917991 RepID=UPI001F05E847|nr:hypothetical protein [Devosia sp. JXJ CY 41]
MFIRTSFCAAGLVLLTAFPAQAAFCTDDRGIVTNFSIQIGKPFTEQELNEFDLMRLRQEGVDATRVERWNGCIRAFVRKPEGGEEMQFYDPNTFERVQ